MRTLEVKMMKVLIAKRIIFGLLFGLTLLAVSNCESGTATGTDVEIGGVQPTKSFTTVVVTVAPTATSTH